MFLARPRAAHCAILGRPEERLFPARRHSQIHELSFADPHLIQSNSCSNTPPRSDDLYRQSDITILNEVTVPIEKRIYKSCQYSVAAIIIAVYQSAQTRIHLLDTASNRPEYRSELRIDVRSLHDASENQKGD